jgi:hypothetical protein
MAALSDNLRTHRWLMRPEQSNEADRSKWSETLGRIRAWVSAEDFRITQHAHQEMGEEGITLDQVLEAIQGGQILENYPEHRRGACCLINGRTRGNRPIHIVCTTAHPPVIIITVYEPKPPNWVTPTQRKG